MHVGVKRVGTRESVGEVEKIENNLVKMLKTVIPFNLTVLMIEIQFWSTLQQLTNFRVLCVQIETFGTKVRFGPNFEEQRFINFFVYILLTIRS